VVGGSGMSGLPTLVLASHQLSVEPGGEAALELRLHSHSAVVDEFKVEVLGPAAAWAEVEPPIISLFPNTEGRAQVRFRPPRSWFVSAGVLSVGFRVASSLDPGRAAVDECDLEIAPYSDLSFELRPRTSRGRLRGRHKLLLHHSGNTPLDVTLSAQETDGDCKLRVKPRYVRLRPGRSARAKLTVRPAYTPWLGPVIEMYQFEASALPRGGAEIKIPGIMRQSALLPRGALTIALVAAAIIAGIFLLPKLAPRLQLGPVGSLTPSTVSPVVGTPTPPPAAGQPTPTGPATPAPPTAAPGGGAGTGGGAPKNGSWTPARAMSAAREQHTATVLQDGRVLVAGGFQVAGGTPTALASAELYDPGSGAWTAAASMAAGRAGQTATPLANGKVLVVGGQNQGGALATAELYDPAANKWSPAGQLQTGRYGHAAVALTSGKVLVAGGRTSVATPVGSTELYDPATNAWAAGPNLSVARSDLTATLLDDGRVLVAGGDASASTAAAPQAAADLIDPQGRAATRAVNMGTGRAGQSATLLVDGRVLVVGGTTGSLRAELYAPATGTWSPAAAPSAARRFPAAVLLPSGQVLVTGGADSGALASAETYNPATNTWSGAPAMGSARWEHTVTLLQNGQVLVAGGSAAFGRNPAPTGSAEIYSQS
jgi:Galactose oxidase, central domain/Kelch motif